MHHRHLQHQRSIHTSKLVLSKYRALTCPYPFRYPTVLVGEKATIHPVLPVGMWATTYLVVPLGERTTSTIANDTPSVSMLNFFFP